MAGAMLRAILIGGLVAALLAQTGCASYQSVRPGINTMQQVRLALGKPTDVRIAPNGDEVWEYARAPMGRQTFVVRFARDGVVKSSGPVLTDETIGKIQSHRSTKAQIRDWFGRPGDVNFYLNGKETWEWRMEEPGTGRTYTFIVQFGPDGTVESAGKVLDFFDGGQGLAGHGK